jgi:type I restriction enzyme S subunit
MSELPEGWLEVQIGEVAEVNPRKSVDLSGEDAVSFVPMAAVDEISGTIVAPTDRPYQEVSKGFTHFRDRDVIFAKITPSMENGKSAVARGLTNATGMGSTEFHVFRTNGAIEPEYLWGFVRQKAFREAARGVMSGAVGQQRVPADWLKEHPLPLAPLPEQQRIVAKVNWLTARTSRSRKELDRLPTLIARYKQRLLALAFSGALTAGWRVDRGLQEPALKTVDELADGLRYGTAQKCYEEPKGVAVLRIPNVSSGKIIFDDIKYTELPTTEFEKLKLRVGDLLVVRSNGSADLVGRPALVDEQAAGMAYAGYLIRIRPRAELIVPEFLSLMLEAPMTRSSFQQSARSTNGIHNVNAKELGRLSIPVFALAEQTEIVRRIASAFAWLDRVAADYAAAARLLPKLDAAILAKAFRGELVPQDPNDEPATVLLERIRAGRSAAPAKVRSRKMASATDEGDAPRRRGRPRKGTTMRKSSKDADVKGQPYLTNLVRKMGGRMRPNELYVASSLDMVDFYQQLSIEYDNGWLKDDNAMVKAA